MTARRLSTKGKADLRRLEGEKLEAYLDGGGVPTIGVGHTGPEVQLGQRITRYEMGRLLDEDLLRFEAAVAKYISVPLTGRQFDALVIFAFNIGVARFAGSTLRLVLNRGEYEQVPGQLRRWVYDNGKVEKGLVKRREAEIAIWREV